MRETELKLTPKPAFAVPDFPTEKTGVATVEGLPSQALRATYYDTADLRLARHGATLRYRTGETDGAQWTLKLPLPDGRQTREELTYEAGSRAIPPQIRDLTTAFVRSETLGPVTSLRTRRRRWSLRDGSGAELAELVDDEVSILDGRRIVGRFRELEIEKRDATDKQLKRIAAALRSAGAVDAEPISKAARALGLREKTAPDVPITADDIPEPSVSATLTSAIRADVWRILMHDPVTRIGTDDEGAHQMRVGARRLRSNLKTFSHCFQERWTTELRSGLKSLGEALGPVRDLDVLYKRLASSSSDLSPDVDVLLDELAKQNHEASESMLERLRTKEYSDLLNMLVDSAQEPRFTSAAGGTADEAIRPALRSIWNRLSDRIERLNDGTPGEVWHKLRIDAKRLRYAVEATVPALGDDAKTARKFAGNLEKIQDALGAHQDALVSLETITAIAKRSNNKNMALAAGRLIERESLAARDARVMFSKAWAKLDRKKNLSWLLA